MYTKTQRKNHRWRIIGLKFMKTYILAFTILFCFPGVIAFGQQLPEEFSDQLVRDDWELPMGFTFDENERMYVWEKQGKVFIIDTEGVQQSEPLVDIHEEVGNWRDHGMLGFALDPKFLENGYIYLFYAVDRHHLLYYGTDQYHPDSTATFHASIGRVTRYTADPNNDFRSVIEGSRKVILGSELSNGIPILFESHGVGSIHFGLDGTLLLSTGDGTSNVNTDFGGDESGTYASEAIADGIMEAHEDVGAYRAQYPGSLCGKILRIDPETGEGIPSNPFYDSEKPDAPQSKVWALGLRNPFKFSVVPGTGSHNPEDGDPGRLMIGDVGGSQWEELNMVDKAGQNFGWPIFEGYIPFWGYFNSYESPFNHLSPNPLAGGNCPPYFRFNDLIAHLNESGGADLTNPCDPNQPIPAAANPFVETVPMIAWSNKEWNTPSRTHLLGFNENGQLSPIEISEADSPVEGATFDGNSSVAGAFYEEGSFPEKYHGAYFHADYGGAWIRTFYFDDNFELQSVEPFHNVSEAIIHLVAHPSDGCLYYISLKDGGQLRKICYGGNPPPIAVAKADVYYGPSPLTVQFDASESFDPFGLPITYHWDFGDGEESTEQMPSHIFTTATADPTPFKVTLTVTDSLGEIGTSEVLISLNNTPPVINDLYPRDGSFYGMNGPTLYQLDAEVSDNEHSESQLQYAWQTFFHHNTHFHPEPVDTNRNALAIITPAGCEEEIFWYRIRLTVTDEAGLSSTTETEVFPNCNDDFFEVIELQATALEKRIELTGFIDSPVPGTIFEVQRNPIFETLGEMEWQGPANPMAFYDHNPLIGRNTYRIKATHPDGYFEYSNTVSVDYPDKGAFLIYPNPAAYQVQIEIKEPKTSKVQLYLYDAAGQEVIQSSWSAIPDNLFSQTLRTDRLMPGVYFYRVEDGEEVRKGRLMIMH